MTVTALDLILEIIAFGASKFRNIFRFSSELIASSFKNPFCASSLSLQRKISLVTFGLSSIGDAYICLFSLFPKWNVLFSPFRTPPWLMLAIMKLYSSWP